jgi:hypothetical protein
MKRDMRWLLGWTFAGLLSLVCWPSAAVLAQQQPGTPASQFAPVAPPRFDADSLKTPLASPHADSKTFNSDKSDKAETKLEIPRRIDLGKSQLEFDARHTTDVISPNVAIDSGESSNLSKVTPARKQEPVLPDYFGLKLKMPMN